MKVMSWNLEWMNNWFVGGSEVKLKDSIGTVGESGYVKDVKGLCQRVADVIKAVDPDVLCVQEGPSDLREMELFVSSFLQDGSGHPGFKAFGGHVGAPGTGQQKNYILVKTDGEVSNPVELDDARLSSLVGEWQADIDGNGELAPYHFTRRPVVVDVEYLNETFRFICLHLKSNFIQRGESKWKNPDTTQEFVRESLADRRRISTESMRVRSYLDQLAHDDPVKPIVVAGDLNDGPGADIFEEEYLSHNVTDILLGSTYEPQLLFEHAFLNRVQAAERHTVSFYDFMKAETAELVLDHILVSPILRSGSGVPHGLINGSIAHAEYAASIDHNGHSSREKYPSDHEPVFAIFGP